MPGWLKLLILSLLLIAAMYLTLIWLARRLPPGLLRDVVTFLPSCLTTARRLRKDPRVPRKAKIALAIAVVWVLSPIDLIPEFLPVIGPLDDVVVVVLAFRYAARSIPLEALYQAWPSETRLLHLLIRERDQAE